MGEHEIALGDAGRAVQRSLNRLAEMRGAWRRTTRRARTEGLMAATIGNLDAYSDALVVLGTAGIVVPLVRRFGLEPRCSAISAPAPSWARSGSARFKEQVPCALLAHGGRRQERLGLCRARRRVPAVPDRAGAVLPAPRSPCAGWCSASAALQVVLSTAVIAGIAALAGSKPAPPPSSSAPAWRCRRPPSSSRCSPTSAACRPRAGAPASPSCWRRTWRWCRSCCSCPSSATARAARC